MRNVNVSYMESLWVRKISDYQIGSMQCRAYLTDYTFIIQNQQLTCKWKNTAVPWTILRCDHCSMINVENGHWVSRLAACSHPRFTWWRNPLRELSHQILRESTPRCSMYGRFTYIYHKSKPNVGKYSIPVHLYPIKKHEPKWGSCPLTNHPGSKKKLKKAPSKNQQ